MVVLDFRVHYIVVVMGEFQLFELVCVANLVRGVF